MQTDRIRSLSKERGISLTYLCKKIGVANVYFIDVDKGKTRITDERLEIIADILHTTPEYLKGETDEKEIPSAIGKGDDGEYIRLDADSMEILREVRERPEMKIMFSLTKGVTTEELIQAIKIVEALRDDNKPKEG